MSEYTQGYSSGPAGPSNSGDGPYRARLDQAVLDLQRDGDGLEWRWGHSRKGVWLAVYSAATDRRVTFEGSDDGAEIWDGDFDRAVSAGEVSDLLGVDSERGQEISTVMSDAVEGAYADFQQYRRDTGARDPGWLVYDPRLHEERHNRGALGQNLMDRAASDLGQDGDRLEWRWTRWGGGERVWLDVHDPETGRTVSFSAHGADEVQIRAYDEWGDTFKRSEGRQIEPREVGDVLGVGAERGQQMADRLTQVVSEAYDALGDYRHEPRRGGQEPVRTWVEAAGGQLLRAWRTDRGPAVMAWDAQDADRIGLGKEAYSVEYERVGFGLPDRLDQVRQDGTTVPLERVRDFDHEGMRFGECMYVLPGVVEVSEEVRAAAEAAYRSFDDPLSGPSMDPDAIVGVPMPEDLEQLPTPMVGQVYTDAAGEVVRYDAIGWETAVKVGSPNEVTLTVDGEVRARDVSVESAQHIGQAITLSQLNNFEGTRRGYSDQREDIDAQTARIASAVSDAHVAAVEGMPVVVVGRPGEGRLIRPLGQERAEVSTPGGQVMQVTEAKALAMGPSAADREVMANVAALREAREQAARPAERTVPSSVPAVGAWSHDVSPTRSLQQPSIS
ncbi:hypothetical protein [Actinomyces succiniciruminis]|uniref:Uncharacterized protein n=1 Tax=Actinomyces succiniciruminis TaxID=1522002 RepID=A0A1L7RHV3_9ACTO|nr:hypothetical protein [Actinomyces succiniciruminis]CED91276.1 Hypothetical protein AAM4_1444 [Actinomyces succiniciruminis]